MFIVLGLSGLVRML